MRRPKASLAELFQLWCVIAFGLFLVYVVVDMTILIPNEIARIGE